MLHNEINRLRHFMFHDPVTLEEVTECVNLSMQRASEIAANYFDQLDKLPLQLKGELCMLKQMSDFALTGSLVDTSQLVMLYQRVNLCERMIAPVMDVALAGTDFVTLH